MLEKVTKKESNADFFPAEVASKRVLFGNFSPGSLPTKKQVEPASIYICAVLWVKGKTIDLSEERRSDFSWIC